MLGPITVKPYLNKMDNNGLENGVNRHGGMVVMDLEYTAWEGSLERGWSKPGEAREIIQIGDVKIGEYRGGLECKRRVLSLCTPNYESCTFDLYSGFNRNLEHQDFDRRGPVLRSCSKIARLCARTRTNTDELGVRDRVQ